MTSSRECPECHRLKTKFTRGVCHSQCYKRHLRAGTVETLPNGKGVLSQRVDKMVETYRRMMREDPSLTQRAIAAKLGVPQSTLSSAASSRDVTKPRSARYRKGDYDYA